ncbi:MAG: Hsp20/alpha crystallin family protein [Candidatus Nealsonbacteria bacterium]|nr:Hsp20/alpha crystallin family protein [Candidatus Nealsonbacteria bacterium]
MSFFTKLKGGIGIEEEKEEPRKATVKKKVKVEIEKKPKKEEQPKPDPEDLVQQEEGQLAIDVYETDDDIVVQSAIGGIKAEDLDISVENDLLTISGSRENKIEKEGKKYFYQECYWGSFMRKVILPQEVDAVKANASVKDGILTLSIPKLHRKTRRKISVKQEI